MTEAGPTTVLIVDDEDDIRFLVRSIIKGADGLALVGEAADGHEALRVWRGFEAPLPDVIILDNRMPGLTGLEVAQEILRDHPEQIIVLFSAFIDDELRTQAGEVGITYCLPKDDVTHIPDVVRQLCAPEPR